MERKNPKVRRLIMIGLRVCGIGALIAIAVSQFEPGPVIFKLGRNGTPHLCGIPLASKRMQAIAYGTVRTLGGKADVAVPESWITDPTQQGYRTNIDMAYSAMRRAGILPVVPSAHIVQ